MRCHCGADMEWTSWNTGGMEWIGWLCPKCGDRFTNELDIDVDEGKKGW